MTILEDRIEYALQSPGNPLSDLTSVDFVLSAASDTSGIRIFPMLIIGCYEMPGKWINISDKLSLKQYLHIWHVLYQETLPFYKLVLFVS